MNEIQQRGCTEKGLYRGGQVVLLVQLEVVGVSSFVGVSLLYSHQSALF